MIVYNKGKRLIKIIEVGEGGDLIDTTHLIPPGSGIDLSILKLKGKEPHKEKLRLATEALNHIAMAQSSELDYTAEFCELVKTITRQTLNKLTKGATNE